MNSLEYQRKLAEFDERIWYHKTKAVMVEHEKSRFILEFLTAAQKASAHQQSVDVVKKESPDAG